ncbi:MAG: hypothetical protein U5O39_17255 [Gammaproteobacteria bacterium]|nr:hypothetical protein [Gammaproteobacteria bacterium]
MTIENEDDLKKLQTIGRKNLERHGSITCASRPARRYARSSPGANPS